MSEPAKLLQKLVRIDSQNPPGREQEIIHFIYRYLKALGVSSKLYEFKPGRPNLVCRLSARAATKRLLLTPHVDTVPAGSRWRFGPFSGKIHKGKVYGRGATDCKANVAVALGLIKKLKQEKVNLNSLELVFAFCADEETGSRYGTKPLLRHLKGIDYAVVLDANEFNIIVVQKGLLHLRVELFGREAHGAYPQRGISAVERGVAALAQIKEYKFNYKKHPLLQKPTLNIGRFSGGDKVNIVAGYAFFELDIRYLPSQGKERIIKAIERIVKKQKIKYKLKILAHQAPIEIDKTSPRIKLLRQVCRQQGIKPQLKASFGATVINFLTAKGIEAFAFGFGTSGQAHARNECVKIANLERGVLVLDQYLRRLDSRISGHSHP